MKIFKKFPAFFLIFFFCCITASAQPLDSVLTEDRFVFIVDSIEIFGNDITEPEIILRELTFELGDSVTTHMVQYNQERIYSLGIFSKVVILPTEVDETKILRITVDESWYIYPLPLAEIKDRDWKKFSYGFDIIVQNFRGRNEFVRSRFTLGYDKSILLGYNNPYLIWEKNIFFDANISYRHVANRSRIAEELVQTSFEQKFSTLSVSSGKRIGIFHRLSGNLSFNYIETPFFVSGISASDERIDRIFAIGGAYSYDTRDLAQFPKEGILGILNFQLKGLGINNINYQVLNLDFREYRHLAGDLV
jgi:outer membrane protein assembly factor BamA